MRSRSSAAKETALRIPTKSEERLGTPFTLNVFWIRRGALSLSEAGGEGAGESDAPLDRSTCKRTSPPEVAMSPATWAWTRKSSRAPALTISRSVEARGDFPIANRYMASSRLVLPCPLEPRTRVMPRLRLRSSSG